MNIVVRQILCLLWIIVLLVIQVARVSLMAAANEYFNKVDALPTLVNIIMGDTGALASLMAAADEYCNKADALPTLVNIIIHNTGGPGLTNGSSQ